MNSTKIEWCDLTINPVVGCSKCSPGCDNCYAERFAARLAKNPKTAAKYAGVIDDAGKWTGKTNVNDKGIFAGIYNSRCSKRVFVGSMCDMFHPTVSRDYIQTLLGSMSLMPHHTFLLLTKRPERAFETLGDSLGLNGFGHIWLGVTVCNQAEAEAKIPWLLKTPAAKRFVSVEPMLGPVNLYPYDDFSDNGHGAAFLSPSINAAKWPGLDWVICGGETGPDARPMHPGWVHDLHDQCQSAGVPFFFKGWGAWLPLDQFLIDPPLCLRPSYVYEDGKYYPMRVKIGLHSIPTYRCNRSENKMFFGQILHETPKGEVRP